MCEVMLIMNVILQVYTNNQLWFVWNLYYSRFELLTLQRP